MINLGSTETLTPEYLTPDLPKINFQFQESGKGKDEIIMEITNFNIMCLIH